MQNYRDYGTPELHKRHVVNRKGGNAYVKGQLYIDLYFDKGLISKEQYEIANNLIRYRRIARVDTLSQMKYEDVHGDIAEADGGFELSNQEYYEIRYKACWKAIAKKDRLVVDTVVIDNVPIPQYAYSRFILLRDGLDAAYAFDSNFKLDDYV